MYSNFNIIHLRPLHTSRFFVVELQIFCWGQTGLKFDGTPVCHALADFLSRLTVFRLGAESISGMLEKTLVHVTPTTISYWLRYARAPTNCCDPPHTSRQSPKIGFEISALSSIARQAPILSLNSPHTNRKVKICRSTKSRLMCGGLQLFSVNVWLNFRAVEIFWMNN